MPNLFLFTPVLTDPGAFRDALAAALAAGDVSAVLLRLAPADDRTLTGRVKALAPIVQEFGAAAIVDDPGGACDLAAVVTRGGADGAQAADPERLRELRSRLRAGERSLGAAGLATRHDAMSAGELEVDYVLFGEPGPHGSLPPLDDVADRAEWWAEIFQVPCVAFAPTLEAAATLARTGAEFVAAGDAVWTHPDGPGAGVRALGAALGRVAEPVR